MTWILLLKLKKSLILVLVWEYSKILLMLPLKPQFPLKGCMANTKKIAWPVFNTTSLFFQILFTLWESKRERKTVFQIPDGILVLEKKSIHIETKTKFLQRTSWEWFPTQLQQHSFWHKSDFESWCLRTDYLLERFAKFERSHYFVWNWPMNFKHQVWSFFSIEVALTDEWSHHLNGDLRVKCWSPGFNSRLSWKYTKIIKILMDVIISVPKKKSLECWLIYSIKYTSLHGL